MPFYINPIIRLTCLFLREIYGAVLLTVSTNNNLASTCYIITQSTQPTKRAGNRGNWKSMKNYTKWEISNARTPVTAILSPITDCPYYCLEGSYGFQPGSLTAAKCASPVAKVFKPHSNIAEWVPRSIFQPLPVPKNIMQMGTHSVGMC